MRKFERMIKEIMKSILLIASILGYTLNSCVISLFITNLIKGKNYSDVGVAMYSNAGFALPIGAAIYIGSVILGFVAGRRLFKDHLKLLFYLGIPVSFIFFIFVLLLLPLFV